MAYVNNELGYVITKPNNHYANLNEYTKKSIIGPPIPPIVPSMNYIQLPQEHHNLGYASLSHDNDGVGYYNVTTGYGNKCTTFSMAKCPQNKIVSPAGGMPAPAPAPAVYEGYTHPPGNIQNLVKDLCLDVYLDIDNCPHSKAFQQLLESHGLHHLVTIKNINNGAVRNEFLHKGGTGVPFTHSKTTGEKVTGLPPNIQTLCATLAPETTIRKSSIKERLNNLQIKIYTTPTCEACNIYKDFLRKHKLIDYVTIIDVTKISDVENDPYLKTNSLPAYPFTYSQTYQTSFAGTPRSVEDIFIFLENQGT